jgi:predicted methyltransferase
LGSIFRALRPGGILVVVDFERIPGTSREWVLEHVRADKQTVRGEIESAGFRFIDEPRVPGLEENYLMRFQRPETK